MEKLHALARALLERESLDSEEIARILEEMLSDPYARDRMGRSAQRRTYDEYLVLTQLRKWLSLLAALGR